jgi:hypothetical protein
MPKDEFEAKLDAMVSRHRRPLTADHQALANGLQRIVDAHQRRREQHEGTEQCHA